jgi:dihydrodipicolinate synthase/N-acetylneuraminate lyase
MPRAIAAALTPLRAGGADLDLDALDPYLAFLAGHGIDGVLVRGTTGEG